MILCDLIFPNDWYTKRECINKYFAYLYWGALDKITVEDGPNKTFMDLHNLEKLPYELTLPGSEPAKISDTTGNKKFNLHFDPSTAITGLDEGALNTIKSILGIQSPSKEMHISWPDKMPVADIQPLECRVCDICGSDMPESVDGIYGFPNAMKIFTTTDVEESDGFTLDICSSCMRRIFALIGTEGRCTCCD